LITERRVLHPGGQTKSEAGRGEQMLAGSAGRADKRIKLLDCLTVVNARRISPNLFRLGLRSCYIASGTHVRVLPVVDWPGVDV
jgi:hypothetical protein